MECVTAGIKRMFLSLIRISVLTLMTLRGLYSPTPPPPPLSTHTLSLPPLSRKSSRSHNHTLSLPRLLKCPLSHSLTHSFSLSFSNPSFSASLLFLSSPNSTLLCFTNLWHTHRMEGLGEGGMETEAHLCVASRRRLFWVPINKLS